MSIFEYNEETELKKIRKDERELGREEGRELGAKALLEIYYDKGLTKEAAVKTLSEKLELSIVKAEEFAETYFHARKESLSI